MTTNSKDPQYWPVVQCKDGLWRSVSHYHGMTSIGWDDAAAAKNYSVWIRTGPESRAAMHEAYDHHFPNGDLK